MNFAEQRARMVETQLGRRGIGDRRVLEAMNSVPREEFVPVDARHSAYADQALSIDCEQTISQPYTVAFMCEAAQLRPDDAVLEIGTGSGYGAAVLSRIVRMVDSVERIPALARQAADRLHRLGYSNVRVHLDDGTLGLEEWAPFDAILVTAAAESLPVAFKSQLTEGGRLVIPIGSHGGQQTMFRFTRRGRELIGEPLGTFSFVPLISDAGPM